MSSTTLKTASVILHTNLGAITLKLDTENTPETSENFLRYARENFYVDTVFHRVISGFMIQGGGLKSDLQKKHTHDPIKNEADKGRPNQRGTVAMARTSDPHSASSQFFINVADNTFLNYRSKTTEGWGYCVFGEITEGMDIVDKITAVKTGSRAGHQDVPMETIVIERVEVIE